MVLLQGCPALIESTLTSQVSAIVLHVIMLQIVIDLVAVLNLTTIALLWYDLPAHSHCLTTI